MTVKNIGDFFLTGIKNYFEIFQKIALILDKNEKI